MLETIITTKLFMPPSQPMAVVRPRLLDQLNDGLHRKLTLISAPAGFGKTTLVSAWLTSAVAQRPGSLLDAMDSDPKRFLMYVIAAPWTVPTLGTDLLIALSSPQAPSTESVLTVLINELVTVSTNLVIVLDDYHLVDAREIDQASTF